MLITGKVSKVDEYPEITLTTMDGEWLTKLTSLTLRPSVGDVVTLAATHTSDGQPLTVQLVEDITMNAAAGEGEYDFFFNPFGDTRKIAVSTKDKTITVTDGHTEIVMEEKEPLSIVVGGVSLMSVLAELIDNVSNLQTFGPPPQHQVMPQSQEMLRVTKQKLEKILKK